MPFTAPTAITIPTGATVTYTAPAIHPYHRGVRIRNRDITVTWRGDEETPLYEDSCMWRGVVGHGRVTVVAWHNDCGRSPRVELTAGGASQPVRVSVRQTWDEGQPPPAEPDPVLPDGELVCTLGGVPVDVVLVPFPDPLVALERRRVFRFTLGPVTP